MNEEYRCKLEREFLQIFFAQSSKHSHYSEYPRNFTQAQKVNFVRISHSTLVVSCFANATEHALTSTLVNTRNIVDIDARAKKILAILPQMPMKEYQHIVLTEFVEHSKGASMDQGSLILFCRRLVSCIAENTSFDIYHLERCLRYLKTGSNQELADKILKKEIQQ